MTTTSDQPSLRSLARTLGCSHAALSKHAHRGSLTRGVRIGDRGRVIVTDAAAAAAQWGEIHVPTIEEMSRPAPRQPPASDILCTVLPDLAMDRAITARELFEERDSHSLLVTALVAIAMQDVAGAAASLALNGPEVAAIRERVAAQLRAVAELHGADAAAVARAEQDLESPLLLLIDAAAQAAG